MREMQVSILMGSKTDLTTVEDTAKVLRDFEINFEIKVLSAHRTPKETALYAEEARGRGIKIIICAAGGSAALAGVVAAHTSLPVIGIPVDSTSLHGMDALLSTVQMPPGVPVGTVAIGKMGAKNAAFLALRILALSDKIIEKKLEKYKEDQRQEILKIKLN